jgi:hypothetical protein
MKTHTPVRAFAVIAILSTASFAAFTIDFQSATVNNSANTLDFILGFNRIPDLYTVNSSGIPADSFQYYIDYDKSPTYPGDSEMEIIVRGPEIPDYSQIPIREGIPLGGSTSGGWGPIRDMVDFTLTDKVLAFSVDLDVIDAPDNIFSYYLELYEFGQMTDRYYSEGLPASPIPAPSAIIIASIGVALVSRLKKNKT